MSLNDTAHKSARNDTLRRLGLADLVDRMIGVAEESYAEGKEGLPRLTVRLPRKWRKLLSQTIGVSDIYSMIKEVLDEDSRLKHAWVFTLYTYTPFFKRFVGFRLGAEKLTG